MKWIPFKLDEHKPISLAGRNIGPASDNDNVDEIIETPSKFSFKWRPHEKIDIRWIRNKVIKEDIVIMGFYHGNSSYGCYVTILDNDQTECTISGSTFESLILDPRVVINPFNQYGICGRIIKGLSWTFVKRGTEIHLAVYSK